MRTSRAGSVAGHPRTEEFDAFGPWVMPVRTPAEVPPLFRTHLPDPTSAEVVLKVPRVIDRRDADPSMHLYDHLLVVDADGLTVLSRQPATPGGYLSRTLPIDRLLAIEESVDLLDARVTVHAVGAPAITVPYNGSSQDVVAPLIDALRRRWFTAGTPTPVVPARPAPVPSVLSALHGDLALVTAFRELVTSEPAVVLRGAHPRTVVQPRAEGAAGAIARAWHAVWPMTVQAAIVCSDGREVQVLHRRFWWVRGTRPVTSTARTIVPADRVRTVEVADHPVYAGVRVVRLGLGGITLTMPVPAGSGTELALVALAP